MDTQKMIHKLVLKVFDELKNGIDHYKLEMIAFGKCYRGEPMYMTIFFDTDAERNDAFADGVCNQIDRKFYELAKPYDKKNVLVHGKKYIYYDSLENVEKNYQGKMPLYFA